MKARSTHNSGFTLIELMVVVAIVAILAGIAFPSYVDHVRKARMTDAKGVLLEAAQWMERQYTLENVYPDDESFEDDSGLAQSPRDGGTVFYEITVDTDDDGQGYTLTAEAAGDQEKYSRCERLTLTHTGSRDSDDADDCW
ncbi:type IV pilin protein [Thiocapsa roseopersicina]|uniref:Type IV pilus assembly protein PilE n=1 Tax=Thiocapsa roseopersicina TaxID=1058 RepID=A0A1H2Z3M8_THIRO|nr:type IV pilin protein [Thiocapsa roseopersicina]SDX11937.1 type IV pilus assembly protein PilE [Thiocapsa roseopersicina]